jgi:DNA-binding transcriptional MerR regulator
MPETLAEGANLPLKAAAQWLGVSPHTLRTWATRRHRIAYARLGGRLMFTPRDLAVFLARHRVEARQEAG